jgi:hypothetical protein
MEKHSYRGRHLCHKNLQLLLVPLLLLLLLLLLLIQRRVVKAQHSSIA